MKFRSLSIVAASLALAAAASVAVAGTVPFTVVLEGKEFQKVADLKVKVTCPDLPCEAQVKGKARSAGEAFKIEPKSRTLAVDEPERFRLKVTDAGELRERLQDNEGKATVKVRATTADGGEAKTKGKIKLIG